MLKWGVHALVFLVLRLTHLWNIRIGPKFLIQISTMYGATHPNQCSLLINTNQYNRLPGDLIYIYIFSIYHSDTLIQSDLQFKCNTFEG